MSVIAPAVGWLVPGAGHLVQKRYGRGLFLATLFGGLTSIAWGRPVCGAMPLIRPAP